MKKQIISLILLLILLTLLIATSRTTESTSPYINQTIKVNSFTMNQTSNTITLNYTLLKAVPSGSRLALAYSYSVPQVSGSSIELTGTVGSAKSVTLTAPDCNCKVRFSLTFAVSTYNEIRTLNSAS